MVLLQREKTLAFIPQGARLLMGIWVLIVHPTKTRWTPLFRGPARARCTRYNHGPKRKNPGPDPPGCKAPNVDWGTHGPYQVDPTLKETCQSKVFGV